MTLATHLLLAATAVVALAPAREAQSQPGSMFRGGPDRRMAERDH